MKPSQEIKIKETKIEVLDLSHLKEKKQCCGDCKNGGKGSCHKIEEISKNEIVETIKNNIK